MTVSPCVLGLIHGSVCPFDNVVLAGFMVHRHSYPNADRAVVFHSCINFPAPRDLQKIGFRQTGPDFLFAIARTTIVDYEAPANSSGNLGHIEGERERNCPKKGAADESSQGGLPQQVVRD